ncbi:TlpA disulfide reductase family protein [Actinoplanes missouriensis]|uniref:TlpA family protein disulfide reductase n=1 Tax=Actinoplanes missouriensis TaxID=1866 RepID=UPI0033F1A1EA
MIRFRAVAPLVMALAVVAGCTAAAESSSSEPETPPPFAVCTDLTPASPTTSPDLPDLSLPCFTGGEAVAIRNLPRPAVINVWASWCAPCREELPVMQGLADRARGELAVIGIATFDRREASASFAADKGVSMPTLYDPDQQFATAIKQTALPATVFVDAQGTTYVHREPMDVDELIKQVKEHTGVTVTR